MITKISVVIPCYKASGKIGVLINRVNQIIPRIKNNSQISIYLVDDCCPQSSWREADIYKNVKIIHHKKNKGVGASTLTGFKQALIDKNDFFIKMDADGQHPPEYLVELVPYLLSLPPYKLFLVKGSRFSLYVKGNNVPYIRRLGSFILEPLARLSMSYRGLTDIANGFISFNRLTLEYLLAGKFENKLKKGFLFESSILKTCSSLGTEVHEFYMHPIYGSNWSSSMRTSSMIFPILFFWSHSIFERLIKKYIFSFNFGSLLLLSSFFSGLISLSIFLEQILPRISSKIYVTAGNASSFTSLFLLSVILFCFFVLYDFNNRNPIKRIYFKIASQSIEHEIYKK